ncbi:MAG: biotin/lipoyl-containing protein, partial [Anaerotignum sp.]
LGNIGQPEGGFPEELQKIVLKGQKPIEGRAGALMEPVDLEGVRKYLEEAHSMKSINPRNVISYALYPKVYDDYCKHWEYYTDVSKLTSDVYFFGLAKGEETSIEIGEGKNILIKYIDMSEPNAEGFRSLTFEINGVMREIKVLDKHLEVKSDGKLKADKNNPFHLGSSIPGTISKVLVKEGEEVKKNQPLLTVEAMKMETSIVANQDGVIDKIYAKEGEKVNQGDLLVSFVQEA